MGASDFLKSVDFTGFAVNVKTIEPKKYLYQSGHAIWWGTAPRIIQTFLESYDLTGSTVYTFCTSGGSGIEQSIKDLQRKYPAVNIISGKRFSGAAESDIKTWLDSLE